MRERENICIGDEPSMMYGVAMVDGLMQSFLFIGDGGVIDVDEAVCRARQ